MNSRWRYLKWRYHKADRRIRRFACSRLYRDENRDLGHSIMVVGTGRSGTTWLADILASQKLSRMMFEPFHSQKISAFRRFHYFQYMRPHEQNDALASYCRRIFTGDIRDGWIDRQVEHLHPEFRVIKDIRANLFLKWTHKHFPEVPLIFIIRHPCAVVLSRMNLGWATGSDIEPFLSQPKLLGDFLADKMEIIERARTSAAKHAVIWSVSNLIPLKQFDNGQLQVVFYEDMCTQPRSVIRKLFEAIGWPYNESILAQVNRPSTTSVRTSAIVTGKDKIGHWKNELSTSQIDEILSVVSAFGLDGIYDDSSSPKQTSTWPI